MSLINGKPAADDLLSVHEQSHKSKAFVRVVEMKIERGEGISRQVIQETEVSECKQVAHFVTRRIKFLILFGIRWKCLRSGRSRSLYHL